MPGCGYVCPACEGRGYNEQGDKCEWCAVEEKKPDLAGGKSVEKSKNDKKDNKNDDPEQNF